MADMTAKERMSVAAARNLFFVANDHLYHRQKPKFTAIDISKPAGGFNAKGYRVVTVSGIQYRVHRIIWTLRCGRWPSCDIDHWDGDILNNSVENLRLATHAENIRNRPSQNNNTSGFKGVYWFKSHKKWRAIIKVDKKSHHLGLFDDKLDAHAAYVSAAKEFHGEFARWE